MNVRRRLMNVIGGWLLAVVLLETAARVLFPVPEVSNFSRLNYSRLVEGGSAAESADELLDSLLHVAKRSFVWRSELDGIEKVSRLNLNGFRDTEWAVEKSSGVPRVAFIGDSIVEGFMAEDAHTIPAVFRRLASSGGGQIEVFNLGVAAAGVRQYVSIARDFVPIYQPDLLFVVLYANDFRFAGYDQSWWDHPLRPRFDNRLCSRLALAVRLVLAGRPQPTAWYGPPDDFLKAVPHVANPWTEEAAAAKWSAFVRPDIAQAMRKGLFNPHAVDRAMRLGPVFAEPADLSGFLADLQDYARKWNTEVSIVYIPNMLQVSDYYRPFQQEFCRAPLGSYIGAEFQAQARMLGDTCAILDIDFLDLTAELRKREWAGERMYWEYDSHMRPEGYSLVAAEIYSWTRSLGMIN